MLAPPSPVATASRCRDSQPALLGLGVAGRLRTGGYRRGKKLATLPLHLWVIPAAPAVGAALALALADQPWPVLLPALTLAEHPPPVQNLRILDRSLVALI